MESDYEHEPDYDPEQEIPRGVGVDIDIGAGADTGSCKHQASMDEREMDRKAIGESCSRRLFPPSSDTKDMNSDGEENGYSDGEDAILILEQADDEDSGDGTDLEVDMARL